MKIEEMAHILRAAKSLTGENVFIVVGSTAIFGQYNHPPERMVRSVEVDMYPKQSPSLSEVIEGSIGAGSAFHGTFGYHADGIDENTAVLPKDWEGRAHHLEGHPLLEGAVAICPEIHDLSVSKLAAFREKDIEWVNAGIEEGLIQPSMVISLIGEMEDDFPSPDRVLAWLRGKDCDTPSP